MGDESFYTRRLTECLMLRHVDKVKDTLVEIITNGCEVDKGLFQRSIDFVTPHYSFNRDWKEKNPKELFKDKISFW